MELFTSSQVSASLGEWHPPFWQCTLKNEEIERLELPVNDMEIFAGLRSLKPYKALEPDGLHAGFFQRF